MANNILQEIVDLDGTTSASPHVRSNDRNVLKIAAENRAKENLIALLFHHPELLDIGLISGKQNFPWPTRSPPRG